jgi:hypothetical protein
VHDFLEDVRAMTDFLNRNPDKTFRFIVADEELWLAENDSSSEIIKIGGKEFTLGGPLDLIRSPEEALRVAWEIWYRYDFPHPNYED